MARAGYVADRRGIANVSVVLAMLVAVALFFVSFEGLSYVGTLIGLGGWSWLVPVALDAAVVVATLLAIVRRAQKRRAMLEWSIVYAATAASSAANFASHAERAQGYLPALVAAAAPILLLLLSHAVIRTLVEAGDPAPRPVRTKPASALPVAAAAEIVPAKTASASKSKPKAAPAAPATSTFPFDEVDGLDEAALLARLDELASDPASTQRGTAQGASFTVTLWALTKVDSGEWTPTTLARRLGHADRNRVLDRVRRAERARAALVA